MESHRKDLGDAHEKIAKLETDLAQLKRGFDPPPLANPMSEEEHRASLVKKSAIDTPTRQAKQGDLWLMFFGLVVIDLFIWCIALYRLMLP